MIKAYTVQLIYRISCEDVHSEQYEEQWRLVFAGDERMALEEARKVAAKDECTFVDRHGRRVSWRLIAVKDMNPLEIENGALLFSTVKEVEPIATPIWEA